MTGDVGGWVGLGVLLLTVAGLLCARHLPGGKAITDGTPPGPPPYDELTETDTSWLRELPAIPPQEDQ